MEAIKLFGQLLLSIILQTAFLIPKAIIFILKVIEGVLRVVRNLFEQLIILTKKELL